MASAIKQPSQPPYGSLAWIRQMIEEGRAEKSIHPVTITPHIAEQLLQLNVRNRSLREKKIEQFRRMMRSGLWRGLNGETIKIKADGTLGDGQHRLTAMCLEARTEQGYIMFGAEESDIETIDQGSARTAGDIVRLTGADFAMERSAIARLLIAYEESDGSSVGKTSNISNGEIVKRVAEDQKIHDAAAHASRSGRRAPGLPGSVVGFLWYIFSGKHQQDADIYLDQVCNGVGLQLKDPAATVRDYLIRRVNKGQRGRDKKIESVIRGWNAFREGREMSNVVTNGSLPELA